MDLYPHIPIVITLIWGEINSEVKIHHAPLQRVAIFAELQLVISSNPDFKFWLELEKFFIKEASR